MHMPICEPEIMTVRAGVLARTPSDHAFRIGVIGGDEEEARRLFKQALAQWGKIADLIDQDRFIDTVDE